MVVDRYLTATSVKLFWNGPHLKELMLQSNGVSKGRTTPYIYIYCSDLEEILHWSFLWEVFMTSLYDVFLCPRIIAQRCMCLQLSHINKSKVKANTMAEWFLLLFKLAEKSCTEHLKAIEWHMPLSTVHNPRVRPSQISCNMSQHTQENLTLSSLFSSFLQDVN